MNLLLVEDNLEDQQLIRDALAETEECGPRFHWFSCEVIAVDYLADAIHCLDRGRFDAVLLDLALPDSPLVLNTFEQIQLVARGTPVICLIDAEDESFGHRLLREGAQDVLVKGDIECGSLARSLRHAIERQRRSRALRSISFFDDLTGFYSRYGFISMASHDLSAARATGAPVTMAVLEVDGFGEDLQDRDLLLLDVAERLQNVFDDAASIGRLDANSFGIVAFLPAERQFGRRLEQFGNELREVREGLRVIGGTVSVPKSGPYDLEQLFEDARPKVVAKPAMLAD